MKTVWKFISSPFTGSFVADVGVGARVVHVAAQEPGFSFPCIWIEHDPTSVVQTHHYQCIGTGHPVPDDALEHVGSAVCADGALVWHVYRVPA